MQFIVSLKTDSNTVYNLFTLAHNHGTKMVQYLLLQCLNTVEIQHIGKIYRFLEKFSETKR